MPRRKPGWWPGSGSPRRPPTAGALVLALSVVLLALPGEALAIHLKEWGHNHSREYIPYRPKGLKQLKKHFGQPCGKKADDARTFFPHAQARGVGGYVVYHRRLALNVGYNIRTHIGADHKNDAIDYGVYGYNCRLMRGGTSWSTHAWGVAIDTNTARNPLGQDHWNGIGADGQRHRRYIPNVWKGWDTGHRFYWGLNFSRPDPHHFQFATGY